MPRESPMNSRRSWTLVVFSVAIVLAVGAFASADAWAARSRPQRSPHSTSAGSGRPTRGGHPVPLRSPHGGSHDHGGWWGGHGSWDSFSGGIWLGWPWWSWGPGWGWPYWDGWWYGYPGSPGMYPPYVISGQGYPASVVTDVRPKKAIVRLDGEEIGEARDFNGTWDHLTLEPGPHSLEFVARGYKLLRVRLDAKPARSYRIAYELEPGEGIDSRSESAEMPPSAESGPPLAPVAPESPSEGRLASGFLRLEVQPTDAAVYLDGRFLARGDELEGLHGAIPLAAGEHRVDVVRPGYKSFAGHVRVDAGKPADLRVDLARED